MLYLSGNGNHGQGESEQRRQCGGFGEGRLVGNPLQEGCLEGAGVSTGKPALENCPPLVYWWAKRIVMMAWPPSWLKGKDLSSFRIGCQLRAGEAEGRKLFYNWGGGIMTCCPGCHLQLT